jgi:hypothetical protein
MERAFNSGTLIWVQEKLLVTSVKTLLKGRVLAKSEMQKRLPVR